MIDDTTKTGQASPAAPLLCCPFCLSDRCYCIKIQSPSPWFRVFCPDCHAQGPLGADPSQATKFWSKAGHNNVLSEQNDED